MHCINCIVVLLRLQLLQVLCVPMLQTHAWSRLGSLAGPERTAGLRGSTFDQRESIRMLQQRRCNSKRAQFQCNEPCASVWPLADSLQNSYVSRHCCCALPACSLQSILMHLKAAAAHHQRSPGCAVVSNKPAALLPQPTSGRTHASCVMVWLQLTYRSGASKVKLSALLYLTSHFRQAGAGIVTCCSHIHAEASTCNIAWDSRHIMAR